MNNDLTAFSDKELSDKKTKIAECITFLQKKRDVITKKWNKQVLRRRVNPVILLEHKRDMESLDSSVDLLNEYNRTLIDEYNRRC